MGKSIWDMLGDDIGGAANNIGSFLGSVGNNIGQGVNQLFNSPTQAPAPTMQPQPGVQLAPAAPGMVPGFQGSFPLQAPLPPPAPIVPPPAPVAQKSKQAFDPFKSIVDMGTGIASSLQQGAGLVGDVALEGGNVLKQLGTDTNPFIDQQTRDAQTIDNTNTTQALRDTLHGFKDLSGNNIGGTSDVDQAATRIANGNGTGQDIAAVAGKGLETAVDATSLLNPAEAAAKGLVEPSLINAGKFLVKNAAVQGAASGTSSGLETYGATGDVKKALMNAGQSAAMAAGTQLLLGGAGLGIHALKSAPDAAAHTQLMQTNPNYAAAFEKAQTLDNTIKGGQSAGASDFVLKPLLDQQQQLIGQMASARKAFLQRGSVQWPGSDAAEVPGKAPVDPITNPKTGETLSQTVKKLQDTGWSTSDIQKYQNAVLGKTPKEVINPNELNSLNPTGGVYVDYNPKTRATMPLGKDMTTLDKTSGKSANEMTTIYRGAPKNQKGINPGDFITTNKELAKSYGENVISKDVPASHILDSKSSPLGEEYLYRPSTAKPTPAVKTGKPLSEPTPQVANSIKVEEVNPNGSKSGDSQYVTFPSDDKISEYRATKATNNLQGEGYVSGKSDIVVKDEDGNEYNRIPYDKAVKKYGATDHTELAYKLVNGDAVSTKPPGKLTITNDKPATNPSDMNDAAFKDTFNSYTDKETGKLVTDDNPISLKDAQEKVAAERPDNTDALENVKTGQDRLTNKAKDADKAVFNVIKEGGSRAEAIKMHQKITGSSYEKATEYINSHYNAASKASRGIVRVGDQPREIAPAGGKYMKQISDGDLKQIVLEAKRRGLGEEMAMSSRYDAIDRLVKDGFKSDAEHKLGLDAVEHPEDLEQHAAQAKNPVKFKAAVEALSNLSHYVEQSHKRLGAPLDHRENYLFHNVDLPNKAGPDLPYAGRSNPNFTKERTFKDVRELEANGYKLKYSNASDYAHDYIARASSSLKKNAIIDYLNKNAPGHIARIEDYNGKTPIDTAGNRFSSFRASGLKDYFGSPELIKHASRYLEPHDLPGIVRAVDTVGQALKQTTLALGGFHDLNVSKRYITQEFASGVLGEPMRAIAIPKNVILQDAAFWSKSAYDRQINGHIKSGAIDRLTTGDGHLTLGVNLDVGRLNREGKNIEGVKTYREDKNGVYGLSKIEDLKNVVHVIGNVPHQVNDFIHSFLFGRKIPIMKIQSGIAELNRYNIPLTGKLTVEQRARVSAITHQINATYGGITEGAIAKSSVGKFLQRLLLLAPDFQGGNINSLRNMVTGGADRLPRSEEGGTGGGGGGDGIPPTDPYSRGATKIDGTPVLDKDIATTPFDGEDGGGGSGSKPPNRPYSGGGARSLAWRQNIGNYVGTLVLAALASGAVALSTGQDPKKAVENKIKATFDPKSGQFLSPGIDLPYKNKKGESMQVKLPGSNIEEIIKAAHDPSGFITGRGSALISDTNQVLTNKNYYGQPLVDPTVNANPTVADKAAEVLKQNLPIPAKQGLGANSTPQDVATGVINTLGGKVGVNPDDPKYKAATEIYKVKSDVYNGFNSNDQTAFNYYSPATKDRNGNFINSPTPYDGQNKAGDLLAHPNVMDGYTKINTTLAADGQSVDPFWTKLNPDQQKALLQKDANIQLGSPEETRWAADNKSWYPAFQQQRAAFFNSLPATDPNKPQAAIQPPKITDSINGDFNQYNALTDPTDKAKFITAHTDLQQYLTDYTHYTNNIRTEKGLPQERDYPSTDPATTTYTNTYLNGTTATRATMRASDPTGYANMQNYMAQTTRYGLDKAAGQDSLVSSGENANIDAGHPTAPSQSYLKNAYNLGNYDIQSIKMADGTTQYSLDPAAARASKQKGYGKSNNNGISNGMVKALTRMQRRVKIRQVKMTGGFHSTSQRQSMHVTNSTPGKLRITSQKITL